jgi:hypothetical protein
VATKVKSRYTVYQVARCRLRFPAVKLLLHMCLIYHTAYKFISVAYDVNTMLSKQQPCSTPTPLMLR